MNPLEWSVTDFTGLYGLLLIAALAAMVPLVDWLRLPGGPPAPGDLDLAPYQATLLLGREAALDAAVAQLLHAGALRLQDGLLHSAGPPSSMAHPLEKALHDAVLQGETKRSGLLRASEPELERMEDLLRQRRLLLHREPLQRVSTLALLPLFAMVALGAVKLGVELRRGMPVGFLVLLLVLALFFCGVFWRADEPFRLNRRGDTVLQALRQQHPGLFKDSTE